MKKKKILNNILSWILIIVVLLIVVQGIFNTARRIVSNVAMTEETTAVITDHEKKHTRAGKRRVMKHRYTYEYYVNGILYTDRSHYFGKNFDEGEEVTVKYREDDPSKSVLKSEADQLVGDIVSIVCMIVGFGAFVAISTYKKRP